MPSLCRCTEYSSVIVAPRRILHVMRSTSLAPGPLSCTGRRVRVGIGASELCASQALTQTAHARERVAYAPLRWLCVPSQCKSLPVGLIRNGPKHAWWTKDYSAIQSA